MLNMMEKQRLRLPFFVVIVALLAVISLSVGLPILAQSDETPVLAQNGFTEVYQQVSPSVVSISVVARRPNSGMLDGNQTVVGGGTGFVVDMSGHVVTNNHVVEGASEIEVSFFDGTLARAQVVGLDPDSDLAVIQVELPEEDLTQLRPVTFGDSDALAIGQTVLAIGSPFGQRWTLTSGIVSAVERSIRGLTDFSIGGVIQTDAAINPGNSGGPLIDLNGSVIGVNSQIITGTGGSSGVGFAIPGNLAQRVAQEIIESGSVNYSYLGITGGEVYLRLIEAFDLPNNTQGVVVGEATPNGPANQAGVQSVVFNNDTTGGVQAVPESVDIITAINGEPLSGISELIGYLAAETEPGQTVTLDVLRLNNGATETLQLDVVLAPRP